jgi:hypothetical protein
MKAKKAAAIKKAAPVKKTTIEKIASKTTNTKATANKASTKNVPIRKVAPEKKAFVKAKDASKKVATNKSTNAKATKGKLLVAPPLVSATSLPFSSHIIPKIDGQIMVSKFSESLSSLSSITFNHGIQFDKSLFEQLLQLSNVAKIRLYNAVNSNNEHTLVVTAADANNNDIYFKIPASNLAARTSQFLNAPAPDDDGVGDMGTKCPAYDPSVTAL